MAEKDYYSFDEALRELSLREEELKRLVSEGEIRAFREGQTMKLRRADVDTLRKELSGGDVVDLGEGGETVVFEDDAMTTQEIGMTTEEIVGLADEVGTVTEEIPAAATVVDEAEPGTLRHRALHRLGRLLERDGSPEEALDTYQRSDQYPSTERTVRLLLNADRRDEAEALLRRLIDDPSCDAEQFDVVAQRIGVGDVVQTHIADAFDENALHMRRDPVGERGQDGELVGGVDAVHIEARIGLRITERLRFGEDGGEIPFGFLDLIQNVIAGAVQNPHHPLDAIARKPFAEGFEDGNPPGHRRFKGERQVGAFGLYRKLPAVTGDQRLVGGDEMLAVCECRFRERFGGAFCAADQLHHHIHIRAGGKR